ncbi:hypothetical protein TNCV_5036521 [Trichonephila clavipes]|nr:hypothetical protein TNCV_5036521 [Trichonephila clavipes]
MGEVKDSNMELNDLRHGVVPVSKNLVNDMLICSSDFEGLIENWQMVRNPAILREPSGEEGIINLVNSKSVCSQEVVTDLLPETQSLLNVLNGDLVAVKINGSNVQTNGQGIKESKGEVALTCGFKKESCIVLGVVAPVCELHFLDDAIRRYTEGGNILGMAYYSEQAAASAYVFMIQSLLSPLEEVVHIMPVKKIVCCC